MKLRTVFTLGGVVPIYVTREHKGFTAAYSFGESWTFWAIALVYMNVVAWGILGLVFAVLTAYGLVT